MSTGSASMKRVVGGAVGDLGIDLPVGGGSTDGSD